MKIFGREPAYWLSLFSAGLALAASFGLPLTVVAPVPPSPGSVSLAAPEVLRQ